MIHHKKRKRRASIKKYVLTVSTLYIRKCLGKRQRLIRAAKRYEKFANRFAPFEVFF